MAQYWRTKSFKVLSTDWEQRLRESGFQDVEEDKHGERVLKQKAVNSYRAADSTERQTKLEYYLMLGELVHSTQFPSQMEHLVMYRHSEGALLSEIAKEMDARGVKRHPKTIRHIIRRWETNWGVKYWTPAQRKLKR